MTAIMDFDQPPIRSIDVHPFTEDSSYFAVGKRGITRIETYEEPGDNAMVAWIRVFKDDEVLFRIRAHYCAISYMVL